MPKEWKKPKPTEGQRAKAASDAKKTIARNKKARHDYTIEDTWEAGLALMGTEVKALRMGRASLVDAWVEINGGEAWLYGANIPLYSQGSWTNHAPTRKRKLLLHRAEIDRMQDRVAAKGYTIVPLELYFIGGRVKVEVALAKGKQEWDKRQALREKQDQREAEHEEFAALSRTFEARIGEKFPGMFAVGRKAATPDAAAAADAAPVESADVSDGTSGSGCADACANGAAAPEIPLSDQAKAA